MIASARATSAAIWGRTSLQRSPPRGAPATPGSNGWNWKPWNDGRAANAEGEKWKDDAGPDSSFFEAMVRCVGTKFPLDAKRLFVGGISAGGSLTLLWLDEELEALWETAVDAPAYRRGAVAARV